MNTHDYYKITDKVIVSDNGSFYKSKNNIPINASICENCFIKLECGENIVRKLKCICGNECDEVQLFTELYNDGGSILKKTLVGNWGSKYDDINDIKLIKPLPSPYYLNQIVCDLCVDKLISDGYYNKIENTN